MEEKNLDAKESTSPVESSQVDHNQSEQSNPTQATVKVEVAEKKGWLKKLILTVTGILGAIFAIFTLFSKNDSYYKEKIKEEKKKDKKLKEKVDQLNAEVEELEKQSKTVEEKIKQKEQEYEAFVENTKKESAIYSKDKEKIKEKQNDTQANLDWVKSRFGGDARSDPDA